MIKKSRPTMRDVADACGVSQSLVSIVFRNAPGASEETRRRVREAAEAIGYVPDERARVLRTTQSRDIGVSFLTNQPFHSRLLDELYSAIDGTDYNLVLSARSSSRDEVTALKSLISYRCGAVVLLGATLSGEEISSVTAGVPVVSVAQRLEAPHEWVASDETEGFEQAIGHLIELGHRDVLFASAPGSAGAGSREQTFKAVAKRLGISYRVESGGLSEEEGARLAEALLDDLPSSIIAFNDRAALGMIDLFIRRGVRVPEDVSIIGVDDSEVARRFYTQITSIGQDTERMARFAAEKAMLRLQGIELESAPRGVLVPTWFVQRSTTGAARR
ncbi:MAG: LacI family DNA-binding transcriptional regulator [Actinomycetaceae bacterium]|nr:LacI family DNA-binding transcriptional regulator [Actinomycetaceae bacterium]